MDLIYDNLRSPYDKMGAFRLEERYLHLTFPTYPSLVSPNGLPDPFYFVDHIRNRLVTKGLDIREFSAACHNNMHTHSRFFNPPGSGPLTHIAIEITGKEDRVKFRISTDSIFIIGQFLPEMRVVRKETDWRYIFETFHPREPGCPMIQTGRPRSWVGQGSFNGLPEERPTICGRTHGSKGKLCGSKDCGCWDRSFASHEMAKYAYNWDLPPSKIYLKSHIARDFKCPICQHIFSAWLGGIGKGSFCSWCSGKKAPCGSPNCVPCYERSFASHPYSKYKYGDWDPLTIQISSSEKREFICPDCRHIFEASLNNISSGGCRCPYCSSRRRCRASLNCEWCYQHSFAMHKRASPDFFRGPVNPQDPQYPQEYSPSSEKIVNFECENGHTFSLRIWRATNGTWCATCVNHTEMLVSDFLAETYGPACKSQVVIPRPYPRSLGRSWSVDWKVVHAGRTVAIECDGDQHFKDVSYFGGGASLVSIQARDVYKMLYCLSHGEDFIRINQTDVLKEERKGLGFWKIMLKDAIERPGLRVQYLEAMPRNSWEDISTELGHWPYDRPGVVEAWVAQNGSRLIKTKTVSTE
jgi:hypothetical protein